MTARIENEELYIRGRIAQILAQNEIPTLFTNDLCIVENVDSSNQDADYNRKDFTGLDCFTIDGYDAKELDDAVSLSLNEDGYILGVHIADVTAYVAEGSPLEASAIARGTTVYFPGSAIPMFPSLISETLCSLIPDVDKRAVSMMIRYDFEGNLLGYEVCR